MDDQGVAISMVYPIMKTIVHKGFDADQFCSFATFDASLLLDVEGRIDGKELERLMIAAAAFTQDDYFGLHQGQIMEFADMGIVGYVMLHSNTVREALTAYKRYNAILCSGFNLDWETRGEEVVIRIFLQHPERISRHCVEDMATSVYRLIGRLSNRQIPLNDVRFEHDAPAETAPYLPAFGRVPQFGEQETGLSMRKEVLDYPILYADPKLLGVFETIAQETLDGLTLGSAFSEQIVQWMKKCLPTFFPTLQQTADTFGMSIRTIQNKLKEEQTTFIDLSTRVRKELALGYLKKREYSVGDIAYVLHFSEPSAFQNAFKKWTGVTPGQYRAGKE